MFSNGTQGVEPYCFKFYQFTFFLAVIPEVSFVINEDLSIFLATILNKKLNIVFSPLSPKQYWLMTIF